MPRGAAPFKLENIVPYFRGGRFAMISIRMRGYQDPRLARHVDRFIAMADHYSEVGIETVRIRREAAGPPGAGG